MFGATCEGLETLDVRSVTVKSAEKIPVAFNQEPDRVLESFVDAYQTFIRHKDVKDEKALFNATVYMLSGVREKSIREGERYPEYVELVKDLSIQLNNIIIDGFNHKKSGEKVNFGDVTFDDVIGNEEFKDCLRSVMDGLLFYDPEKKKNPYNEFFGGRGVPTSIFVYGPPGTGKTYTVKAAVNYMKRKGERLGKSDIIEVVEIDNANTKSKYYGESSKNLKELFKRGTDPEKIGVILIDEIDSLLPKRDAISDRPEDKAFLGTFLELVEGLKTTNNGNYVMISITNLPEELDPAIKQRLSQESIEVKGPKNSKELADMMKLYFGKLDERILELEERDWEEIGVVAYDLGLVGRDVKNISIEVISNLKTRDGEIPERFYRMNHEELKDELCKLCGRLDKEKIIDSIKLYKRREKEQKDESMRRKVKSLAEKAAMEMKALKLAQGVFDDRSER